MSVDFVVQLLPIVSLSDVVKQPEERSKNDETNTYDVSKEVHSTCYAHTDPYMFSPQLDNPASVSNQMMILSGDDSLPKRENPIMPSVDLPTVLVGK
jgi:hypothetical protein